MNTGVKRNGKLDFLRGIAIIIVMLGHAIQANLVEGQKCFVWDTLILAFQMPLMMFISGFSAYYAFINEKPNQLIVKKIKRLLIPYISWALIYYILMLDNNVLSLKSILFELFFSDFWFLRELFIFFFFLYVIKKISILWNKNKIEINYFLLILSFFMITIFSKKFNLSFYISGWYYLFFILGLISNGFFQYYKDRLNVNNLIRYFAYIFLLLSILTIGFAQYVGTKWISINGVGTILTCGFIFYDKIKGKRLKIVNIGIEKLGQNTLALYAIHVCVFLNPIKNKGFYEMLGSKLNFSVSVIATFIVWLIFSNLIIFILKKNKLFKILLLGEWDY